MRVVFLFLAGIFALTNAVAAPISTREVALMLRSGFSNESVMREIANRRVLDPLDPATKKTLLEFNASPQLINALESGAFAAPPTEVEEARQHQAEIAAHQNAKPSPRIEKALPVTQTQPGAPAAPPAEAAAIPVRSTGAAFAGLLTGKLLQCRDGAPSPVDSSVLESKRVIAFYFSAHWDAASRKFTPQLVDFYNRVTPEHPEFELIFVSLDRSRFNWETYIHDTHMPWLAVDFDAMAGLEQLKQLGGQSIPCLLVLNERGQIVATSYDGEKYVGPENALASLGKLFGGSAAGPIAQAR